METESDAEIISPLEFMKRMRIQKTTFWSWKKSGKLIRGKHYVQIGAVVRIFWSMELVRELDNQRLEQLIQPTEGNSTPVTPRKGSAIDFNY